MPTRPDIPDDFNPQPTQLQGGIARLIRCWESCRDSNSGGYGSGVVQAIDHWAAKSPSQVTSCSPFTATVIGMMFDQSGSEAASTTFKPMYDAGKVPLPSAFYALHNGFYLDNSEAGKKRRERFNKFKWPRSANDAAGSVPFFNLGYEIDPRDMRRGDLVKIEWANGGGHATFCWDVHLDANGAVDCFQYLSANGSLGGGKPHGPGVSVAVESSYLSLFVQQNAGKFEKVKKPLFSDDTLYLKYGRWICLPDVKKSDVDVSTFKDHTPTKGQLVDASAGGHSARELAVVRFWGVGPPEHSMGESKFASKFDQAKKLAQESPPKPYATGKGKPEAVHVTDVPVKKVARSTVQSDPDAVKKVPPQPAQQRKERTVPHQHFVEQALTELHAAGWIDRSPGKSDNVADASTTAAVRDFQTKFKLTADGIAGPVTRRGLRRALADLHAGRTNSNKPDTKPRIDRFYWLRNRVRPGQSTVLVAHGLNLEMLQTFEVSLSESKSGKSERFPVPLVLVAGRGVLPVTIPDGFKSGTVLVASVHGTSVDGTKIEKKSEVPLYIDAPIVPVTELGDDEWPWDETQWPTKMRNVVAELRATQAPTGSDLQQREITQYGVKEEIRAGDIPVLDPEGHEFGRTDRMSLYKADIEGTMRLHGKVLNIESSGHVYDVVVDKVVNGKHVQKHKPNPAKFDPSKSRWRDVTARAPWGAGARTPLIPFRTLACNGTHEPEIYYRKVFIEQLAGLRLPTGEVHNGICIVGDCGGMSPGQQFDFFVGREDHHIAIPSIGASQGGSACRVAILDVCAAAKSK